MKTVELNALTDKELVENSIKELTTAKIYPDNLWK